MLKSSSSYTIRKSVVDKPLDMLETPKDKGATTDLNVNALKAFVCNNGQSAGRCLG